MARSSNSSIPVFDHSARPNAGRMPQWIRQPLGDGGHFGDTARALTGNRLHTVCEEARCPNRGECWGRGTATFMLLGDTCTRACGFCAVKTGRPSWFDSAEPQRVAAAALAMGLDYVVITSVNRDDLPDGGAAVFADTLLQLRRARPAMGLEILTPDFHRCQGAAVDTITGALGACPGEQALVWGHNMETVPRLYQTARKGADYQRSLDLLACAAARPGIIAKSALMLGLGETRGEVLQVMTDMRRHGVERLALGQYLRPTRRHLPVAAYITPAEFADYAAAARAMGFAWVKAGPMVRSSYHAEEQQPQP